MTITHSFSIARFTYVPPEHYESIEAAFSSKPLADWLAVTPNSHLTLQIQQSYDSVLMKCLDGHEPRNFWDLTKIKLEMDPDPSRRIVITKFPYIVFRWYSRQDHLLYRIQFKLNNRTEFTGLTKFCIDFFGSIRDLSSPTASTSTSQLTAESYETAHSQFRPPTSYSSQNMSFPPSSQQPPWQQKSSQSVSKMLHQAETRLTSHQHEAAPPSSQRHLPSKSVGEIREQGMKVLEKVNVQNETREPLRLSEQGLLGLIGDDEFMKEVVMIAELWEKMGMHRRLFASDSS